MRKLRRFLTVILASVTVLTLAACGGARGSGNRDGAEQAAENAIETAKPDETPAAALESLADLPETLAQAAETLTADLQTSAAQVQETAAETLPAVQTAQTGALPADAAGGYDFSSGAGGWGTEVTLNADGTFEGHFHDSDMGDTGEGYPNGTVYFCDFHGRFGNIRQDDATTWSMTLEELTVTSGFEYEAYIEDGIHWVPATPYGFEAEPGTTFYLYGPDHAVAGLSEEFMSWMLPWHYANPQPSTLGYYAIHNTTGDYGFCGES